MNLDQTSAQPIKMLFCVSVADSPVQLGTLGFGDTLLATVWLSERLFLLEKKVTFENMHCI